jgi:hypothetical protein
LLFLLFSPAILSVHAPGPAHFAQLCAKVTR